MGRRRAFRALLMLAATTVAITACGSTNEDHPPPTIGDATVVERPADTTTSLP